MKGVYAPSALRDIGEILEYVHTRSPSGARNVSLAIEYSIHACALTPRAGGRTDEPNVYVDRWANTATRSSIARGPMASR